MLSEEGIKKLVEVFATKEDFEVFRGETRKGFSDLQTAVDAYAKRADTYFQEMVALAHRVDRHEKWIQQLAEKLGGKTRILKIKTSFFSLIRTLVWVFSLV